MDNQKAIEYFYRQMELGNIKNDTEQEVYELAIHALEKIDKPNKTTNFDRITKDKQSLINFVREEVLDLSGPHMNHSIDKFKSQHKFNEWLKEEVD